MKDEEEIYDYIDAYLKGKSNDGIRIHDEALTHEIEVQKTLKEAVVLHRLAKVSATVQSIDAQTKLQRNIIKGVVVMVVVAVAALGIYLNTRVTTHKSNNQDTIKEIYVTLPESTISKTEVQTTQSTDVTSSKLKSNFSKKKSEQEVSTSILTEENDSSASSYAKSGVKVDVGASMLKKDSIKDVKTTVKDEVCDPSKMKAAYTFSNPCQQQQNGQIQIESPYGGVGPYVFSIDGGKRFQKDSLFASLGQGKYDMVIKDFRGCTSEIWAEITMIPKLCEDDPSDRHIFNPIQGYWAIPVNNEWAGVVEIYNGKTGSLVYMANFNKFEPISWSGRDTNGEQLSPGLYLYKIRYENTKVEQGSVTIVY